MSCAEVEDGGSAAVFWGLLGGGTRGELPKITAEMIDQSAVIAGQAFARGLTLITANVREFARVDGLKWEDWALPVG